MNSILSAVISSAWLDFFGHIALKCAGLLVLALVAGLALRRASAARRYVLWFSSLLAVVAVTIAAPLLPAWRVLPAREVPVMEMPVQMEEASTVVEEPLPAPATALMQPPISTREPAPVSLPPPRFQWPTISRSDVLASLPLAWLLIATTLGARLVISSLRLILLRRKCATAEVPRVLSETMSKLASMSGKTAPKLLIGPAGSIPMVWGIIQPCLLLPADAVEWPEEKLRSVLLHELAHLRRRDPAALLVAQVAQALHWFNPLAWLTVRRLRADQERACDDAVLRRGIRASDYAQHLLDISQRHRLAPSLGLCALAMARSAPVESRLAAILDPCIRREASSRGTLALSLVSAAVVAMPLAMLANEAAKGLRGRILDRHGVVLAESTKEKVRQYPLKALGASVLGYVRKSGRNDSTPGGREGIEKAHNDKLRNGEDVRLSLDARIQALSIRAMQEAGVGRGAVVVLDPRDGDVLAAASLPSFDPNHFIPVISLETWDLYDKDKTLPLLDRCLRGKFAPGSALMPLTALGGVSAGIGNEKFNCTGSVTYGSKDMKCWISNQGRSHGALDLEHALQTSCNCFWYQFGNKAGSTALEGVARRVGFGEPLGVLDGEREGVFPSESWLKENRPDDRWTPAAMANLSIGQGLTQVTPMQMAMLAATLASGGHVPSPRLVDPGEAAEWRADLVKDGSDPKGIERIRKGMWLVVNEDGGSGGGARSTVTQIAGKTGTAQYVRMIDGKQTKDNHCWFIGFAPYDKPTLAFAVLVQGGKSGGGVCAPIAKRIVEETLALPADGSGKVEPVEEQAGHFNQIESTAEEVRKTETTATGGSSPPPRSVFSPHNLVPRKRNLMEEARQAAAGEPEPPTHFIHLASGMAGRYKDKDAVDDKIKPVWPIPDGANADEDPVKHLNDDTLFAFLKGYQEKPGRFHVRVRRTHYFDDDVPDPNGKDCFEIQPMSPAYVGFAFVPKSSSLAADLAKRLTWNTVAWPCTVELKWNKAGGTEWVELVSLPETSSEPKSPAKDDDGGGPGKPSAGPTASQSGGATDAPSVHWQVIKHDGRDHVTLENVKTFYHFDSLLRNGNALALRTSRVILKTEVGSREMLINGVKFVLSDPVVEIEGNPSVSQLDLTRLIDPVLRPSYIKNTSAFDTVVIDPGHGGHDAGAKGVYGLEKDLTLKLGLALKAELLQRGIEVVMTRETDDFKAQALRVKLTNDTPNSILISLHFNSGDKDASGVETYALTPQAGADPALNSQNIALATAIHARVVTHYKLTDHGVKRAPWTKLPGCERPGILFEGGFITNGAEARMIASETYLKALASTMADAVLTYRKAIRVGSPVKTKDAAKDE